MSKYSPVLRRKGNSKSSLGHKTQVIPIFKEITVNHEWTDKKGNVYNKGMTSTRKVQVSSRFIDQTADKGFMSKQLKRKTA